MLVCDVQAYICSMAFRLFLMCCDYVAQGVGSLVLWQGIFSKLGVLLWGFSKLKVWNIAFNASYQCLHAL